MVNVRIYKAHMRYLRMLRWVQNKEGKQKSKLSLSAIKAGLFCEVVQVYNKPIGFDINVT